MNLSKINHTNSFQIFHILKYGALVLISVALAKSYLSTEDLGKYETFLFVSSTVSFFWVTGLMQTLLGYSASNKNPDKKNTTIFFSSFFLLIILSLLSAIIIYISFNIKGLDAFNDFGKNERLLLIAYLIINPASFLIEYLLLLKKRYKNLIVFGLISTIIPCIIVPLPALFGFDIEFCFYGLVIWSIIKLLILLCLLTKHSTIRINKKEIQSLFIAALPLIGTTLIVGSASYVDGIIITTNYDVSTFAIFRFGAREFPLFILIASAFGTSLIPLISGKNNIEKELELIKNKSKQMIYYLFPVAFVFLLSSQYLFPLVFNPDFKESYKVFDIYLLLIISRFVFPQSILMGFEKYKTILSVSVIELLINVLFSLLFIYYFGFIGVAFGTLVAYFIEKLLLIGKVKKNLNIGVKKYVPTKQLVVYSLLLISVYVLKNI